MSEFNHITRSTLETVQRELIRERDNLQHELDASHQTLKATRWQVTQAREAWQASVKRSRNLEQTIQDLRGKCCSGCIWANDDCKPYPKPGEEL